MSAADVSVVIPAYRAAGTIARAIESVLAQTRPAAEILVIDDGSPDDLGQALSGFAGRVRVIRKRNGGAASARNAGLYAARGDVIAFLDADDHWEPHKLERQLAILAAHPDVGTVGSRFYIATPDGARDVDPSIDRATCDRVLQLGGAAAFTATALFWTGTIVVRRDVLAESRFDTTLSTAEDRDLWMRLLVRAPAYLVGDPLATCVFEDGSLSRSNIERDCLNLLTLGDRYRALIGEDFHARWVADVYRRWAGRLLAAGDAVGALGPALARLRRDPSPQAVWVLAKAAVRSPLALVGRGRAETADAAGEVEARLRRVRPIELRS